MKVFIETTLNDFFLALFKDEKIVDFILEKNMEKKSDFLPIAFEDILKRNNLNINQVEAIYTTKGPGSFMGIRASLIFGSIIAKVKNIPFLVKDSLAFFGNEKDFSFDAKGGLSYFWDSKNKESKLVDFKENSSIDWDEIINNWSKYINNFEKINPTDVECNYIKEPKIG